MLDWDDLRFFLALARTGSLSAAARDLRVAQSTVGRRLASLETSLGVRLLNRTPDGYQPTLAGEEVRAQAERLETEALSLERTVGGRDNRLSGLVRVTCAETIASYLLAPCFAALHAEHPDMMVELISNPRELSLAMREAEISGAPDAVGSARSGGAKDWQSGLRALRRSGLPGAPGSTGLCRRLFGSPPDHPA